MGVFASAVMLYGMSLLYGVTGSTLLTDISAAVGEAGSLPIVTMGVVFTLIGFAFKVAAVPFHTWAPDVYEGAPTPITAFLSVSSKAAGFVALLQLVLLAFPARDDIVEPTMWILAALSMTVGNVIALRQTNIVRMLAYSGIAQAGFMLAPLAVVGENPDGAVEAVVTYLLIYAAMNLGAFAVVLAVARKTRSAEVDTWGGLFEYAPGLTVVMTRVPVQPGRDTPARRLAGQVRRVPSAAGAGDGERRAARRRRGRELGHRALLLRQRRPADVDAAGARRRPHPDPGADQPHRGDGSVRRGHLRLRGVEPRHPLRRPGHLRLPVPSLTSDSSVQRHVREEISRRGPIPYSEVVEAALYGPEGFYQQGGKAGRRGDFLTSPEVGPLFGILVGRALDREWERMGEPDPFVVVEAGAGPGTLARTVLAGGPACEHALRYVLVERSATQRAVHAERLPLEDPAFAFAPAADDDESRAASPCRADRGEPRRDAPAGGTCRGVRQRAARQPAARPCPADGGWLGRGSRRCAPGRTWWRCSFRLMPGGLRCWSDLPLTRPAGARTPLQDAATTWLRDALSLAGAGGAVIAIDYASTTAEMAQRTWQEWVRTYQNHARGDHPLRALGSQDITCEVAMDQLAGVQPPARVRRQADWLVDLGVDELVAEGRRTWSDRAHIGDLEAVKGRSRIGEAEALTDPTGLGSFRVMEWR